MSESVLTVGTDLDSIANSSLKFAARLWFVVAVIGQWMFAYYVTVFYGGRALRGISRAGTTA